MPIHTVQGSSVVESATPHDQTGAGSPRDVRLRWQSPKERHACFRRHIARLGALLSGARQEASSVRSAISTMPVTSLRAME